MRAALVCVLLAAAGCSSPSRAPYAPGSRDLDDRAREEYRAARRLDQAGRREEALAALDALTGAYPESVGFHLYRVRLARTLRGPEKAAALYEPAPPDVDAELAALLAKLAVLADDDVAGRRAVLESATAQQPREPFWRLGIADVLLTAFEILATRAERERALGQMQVATESMAEAKRVLEEARQEAETALQYDPEFKEAQLLLGFIAVQRAECEESRDQRDAWRLVAADHYGKARDLDPECVSARLNLAENHLYFAEYSAASRELEVAAELAPNEPRVWNSLGLTRYSIGRLADAIDAYRRALELDPRNARTRTALSDCLRRTDRWEEALVELQAARGDAADDAPLSASIAFKLAAIYERQKRYKDAIREYERHIALEGADSAKAKSRIRWIYEHAFER